MLSSTLMDDVEAAEVIFRSTPHVQCPHCAHRIKSKELRLRCLGCYDTLLVVDAQYERACLKLGLEVPDDPGEDRRRALNRTSRDSMRPLIKPINFGLTYGMSPSATQKARNRTIQSHAIYYHAIEKMLTAF